MIAVDTSAIVAIVFNESERESFVQRLEQCDRALVSTVSVVEAHMVVHGRRKAQGVAVLDALLGLPVFEIVAPGRDEAAAANIAFEAFGKGSGHPAELNFGDLFSYALAKVRGVPLLFKGADFGETDIESAINTGSDPG